MKSRTGRAWYCSCRREAVIALRGLLRMLRRERRRSWSRPSWGQITSLCLDSLSHVGFCTSLKITRLWLTIVQLPVGACCSVCHGQKFCGWAWLFWVWPKMRLAANPPSRVGARSAQRRRAAGVLRSLMGSLTSPERGTRAGTGGSAAQACPSVTAIHPTRKLS